jgi:hypothetical protein
VADVTHEVEAALFGLHLARNVARITVTTPLAALPLSTLRELAW